MSTRTLKQLALMGLVGGLNLATEGNAETCQNQVVAGETPTYLTAGGCGGKGGCGGMSGRSVPGKENNYYTKYRKQTRQELAETTVSEQALLARLSKKERAIYHNLNPEAKKLMLKVAGQNFQNQ